MATTQHSPARWEKPALVPMDHQALAVMACKCLCGAASGSGSGSGAQV